MSNREACPILFHIRSEPLTPAAVAVEAELSGLTCPLATCPDVYRGLARVLTNGREATRAVLVCVDGLSEAELEFFSIVSAGRGGPAVYVYGDAGASSSRIADAIARGATGEATAEAIRRLKSDDARRVASAPTAEASRPAESAEKAAPEVEMPSPEASTPLSEDEPSVAERPRVPWMRYGDAPVRRGPGERVGSGPNAAPARPGTVAHQPLVSDEELRALMAEDEEADGAVEEEGEDAFEKGRQS